MNKFWTGGARAYQQALQEQHQTALEELRAQLQAAESAAAREAIEQQIVRLTEAYREKSRAGRRSLF